MPQTILPGKPLHTHANVEKGAPNHPGRPLHTPPPFRAMPIWKQHISKRGFPYKSGFSNLRAMWYLDLAASTNHPWQEEAGALCQQQFKYSSSEDFRGISFQILILLGQFQIFSFGGQLKYYISELSFKMLLFWGFQVLSFIHFGGQFQILIFWGQFSIIISLWLFLFNIII